MDILLAIRNDGSLAEVRLEPSTKTALSTQYDGLRGSFIGPGTEIQDYVPAFRPDDDGVLRLKFDLPAPLWSCRQALPGGIPALDATALAEGIRALVGINVGKKPIFHFQAIDSRFTIQPHRIVFLFDQAFRLNDRTGIVFADRLDAVHEDGHLYFKSEMVVRRFLDIEEHFTAATDAELQTLFTEPAFAPIDLKAVKVIANTTLRRKLHGVLQSGRVLNSKSIQAAAKKIGVPIQVTKGKVVVPTSLKEFRDFVRILDDAYLESILDGTTVYLTTSKRPVAPPAK